ncbi:MULTISPECIES: hypothetical protein [unclassified Planococcus (in: firmicutes)]|uniref:hypothetical protein n=1 Tax=Planococcus TaxID=1372 RepID=UPI000C34C6B8|nr:MULTISPECIES: hypothetical protein [unclassified Planococcus (in: firmicutes)]AUD13273.1 hypothetical protein CW734_05670 [Planococcus sp. MB-3u-03]PKG45957.1 hypothetical protein CXF66_09615 [Planococcus sp. Urea-trap-24]PKG89170.1 hypothetical protein CXF91_10140 [Planococcus sp. Urea-3u-39]PKH41657.1 hypothetical protein CXF77_05450 [Planococcus sp. MB-3u-09]
MENWKAVELVKDLLFGLGLYALITVVGLFVTMATSRGSDTLLLNDEVRGDMATSTLLWMVVPAFLLSLGLSALRRIRMKNAALRISIVWAVLLLFLYLVAALWSGIFTVLIASVSFYLFLVAVFLGPIVYSFLKKLPAWK